MTLDQEMVAAMRAGDERAFDRFFRDYSPRLYRFVLPRLRRNESAAEEVCQEVLGRAMRRIDSWRGEAALFTWLCQIARNEITDYWRRRRRQDQMEVFVEDDPSIAAALESIETDLHLQPEQQNSRVELVRLVQVALDHLPANYGYALEWKYIDGHSVAEIAERLGQTSIATQSLLARARTAFRDAFTTLNGGSLGDLLPFQIQDQANRS
ncbi:MAG: RNA polymerase sigma factor [Steroidobacteraceae bacterium]